MKRDSSGKGPLRLIALRNFGWMVLAEDESKDETSYKYICTGKRS